jgi:hypothetical protein
MEKVDRQLVMVVEQEGQKVDQAEDQEEDQEEDHHEILKIKINLNKNLGSCNKLIFLL